MPTSVRPTGPSKSSTPAFKFKPGKNKEFKKRVYQVASDCIEDFQAPDEDDIDIDEYVANMADDDGPEQEHLDNDGDDDHEDSAAMALAALALQGLSIN